jgi:hypothetical protein
MVVDMETIYGFTDGGIPSMPASKQMAKVTPATFRPMPELSPKHLARPVPETGDIEQATSTTAHTPGLAFENRTHVHRRRHVRRSQTLRFEETLATDITVDAGSGGLHGSKSSFQVPWRRDQGHPIQHIEMTCMEWRQGGKKARHTINKSTVSTAPNEPFFPCDC